MIFSLALFAVLASAPSNPAAAVEPPRPVSSGAFTAVEVPTRDAQRFTTEWDKPGARAELHIDGHVDLGGSITAFIVFKGCTVNPAGACDVAAEVSRVDPAGEVLGPAMIQVFAGKPVPQPGAFMRSQAAPTFTFEDDPVGRYLLRAKVTDRVAGVTVELSQAVTYGP